MIERESQMTTKARHFQGLAAQKAGAIVTLALGAACAGAPPVVARAPAPPPVALAPAPASNEDALPAGWRLHEEPGKVHLGVAPEMRLTPGSELGVGTFGKPLVRIALSESAFAAEKTNFTEAYLLLSVAEGPRDLAACTAYSDLERESEFRDGKTVHGVEFASRTFTEGAAGNVYESRVYRTLRRNGCYEVTLTVRTGNLENYEPGSTQAFDVEKAFKPLEQVFETLRFRE